MVSTLGPYFRVREVPGHCKMDSINGLLGLTLLVPVWIQRKRWILRSVFLLFFFFSFSFTCLREETKFIVHCSRTVPVLFTYCSWDPQSLYSEKNILKIGPTILFTYLKIILLQCFQFLIFNFSNNKFNLNRLLNSRAVNF